MLIAERLLLLALEPLRGTLVRPARRGAQATLSAAMLAELILGGRLRLDAATGRLFAGPSLPIAHPLLERLRLRLVPLAPLTTGRALARSARTLPGLCGSLLDGMFRRDLLHRRWGWCGWRPARLYPLRSRQPRNEAAEALREGARSTEPRAESVLAHLFLRLGGWGDLRSGLRVAGFDEAFLGTVPTRPAELGPAWRWLEEL